ncbi:hypothetical protein [Paenibacillus lautus]|uniref:hypothetical protein n=1 Tax=Paenibacillus lautus TaxID=1401 RepID=UPI001FD2B48F|nr:hypothetical protein [Paenibacillus lautus]
MNKFTTSVLAGEPFADMVQLEYKSALPVGEAMSLWSMTRSASNQCIEMEMLS